MHKIRTKKGSPKQKNSLQVHEEWDELSSISSPTPHFAQFFSPASLPSPDCSFFPPELLYLDLNIYRESVIKALIKEQSEDLYRLIKRVHFDGKCYRVKCVRSGEWKHCWDLAVSVQFFGMMQGLAFEPKRIVSRKDKKIIYRSLVLVNPYELWERELVERLWNLQDRIEFLIAKILFHECIRILIFFGKTLPQVLSRRIFSLNSERCLSLQTRRNCAPKVVASSPVSGIWLTLPQTFPKVPKKSWIRFLNFMNS